MYKYFLYLFLFWCGLGSVDLHASSLPFKVDVLSRDAGSAYNPRNISLRLKIPDKMAMPLEITKNTLSLYVLPSGLDLSSKNIKQYLCKGIFIKYLRDDYYIDVRQLPANIGRYANLAVVIAKGNKHYQQFYPKVIKFADERTSVVLIVDSSYSMRQTDPQRLRVSAAKSFVDQAARSARRGGSIAEIGIVKFSSKARALAELTPSLRTKKLHKAIDSLGARGRTDIDAGLDRAFNLFEKSHYQRKIAILLSDGKNEVGTFKDSYRRYKFNNIIIYTIGLSNMADAALLTKIANETGGKYFEAPTQKDLYDIYQRIATSIQKRAVVHSSSGKIGNGTRIRQNIVVDSTLKEVEFSANISGDNLDFILKSPNNKKVNLLNYSSGDRYGVYHFIKPNIGNWTAFISNKTEQKNKHYNKSVNYSLRIEGDSPLFIEPFFYRGSYLLGEPVDISCSLSQSGKVLKNVKILAKIVAPDKTVTKLHLLDDGNHNDSQINDGVFSNYYNLAYKTGVYNVIIYASGNTLSGEKFTRYSEYSFSVSSKPFDGLKISQTVLDLGVVLAGQKYTKNFDLAVRSGHSLKVNLKLEGFENFKYTYHLPKNIIVKKQASVQLSITPKKTAVAKSYFGKLVLTTNYSTTIIPVQLTVVKPQILFVDDPIEIKSIGRGAILRYETKLVLNPKPSKKITAKVKYFKVVDLQHNEIKSANLVGDKTITFVDGIANLTFLLKAPIKFDTKWLFSWIEVENPIYSGKVKIQAKRFDATLSVKPKCFDFGTINKLPFKASKKIVLSSNVKNAEQLTYAIVVPDKTSIFKKSWLQIAAPTKIKPNYSADVVLNLSLPRGVEGGDLNAKLRIKSTNGQLDLPIDFFISSLSKRKTFHLKKYTKPIQIHHNQLVYENLMVSSLLSKNQKIRIKVSKNNGFKIKPMQNEWSLSADDYINIAFTIEANQYQKFGLHNIDFVIEGSGLSQTITRSILLEPLPTTNWRYTNNLGLYISLFKIFIFLILILLIVSLFIRWIKRQERGSMTKYIVVSSLVHLVCILLLIRALQDLKTIKTESLSAPVAVKIVKIKKWLGAGLNKQEQQLLSDDKLKPTKFKSNHKIEKDKLIIPVKKDIQLHSDKKNVKLVKPSINNIPTAKQHSFKNKRRTQIKERDILIKLPNDNIKNHNTKNTVKSKNNAVALSLQRQQKYYDNVVDDYKISKNLPDKISEATLVNYKNVQTSTMQLVKTKAKPSRRLTKASTQIKIILPTTNKQSFAKINKNNKSSSKVNFKRHSFKSRVSFVAKNLNMTNTITTTDLVTYDYDGDIAVKYHLKKSHKKSHKTQERPVNILMKQFVRKKQKTHAVVNNGFKSIQVKRHDIDIVASSSFNTQLQVNNKTIANHQLNLPINIKKRKIAFKQIKVAKQRRHQLLDKHKHTQIRSSATLGTLLTSRASFSVPQVNKRIFLQRQAIPKKQILKSANTKLNDLNISEQVLSDAVTIPSPNWAWQNKSPIQRRIPQEPYAKVLTRGDVEYLIGKVSIIRNKKELSLHIGNDILAGDIIKTDANSLVRILLSGRSMLVVGPSSMVEVGALIDLEVGARLVSGLYVYHGALRLSEDNGLIQHFIGFNQTNAQIVFEQGDLIIDNSQHNIMRIYMGRGFSYYIDNSTGNNVRFNARSIIELGADAQLHLHPWRIPERAKFNNLKRRLR